MNPLTTLAERATDTGVTDRGEFKIEIEDAMGLWEKGEYENARIAAKGAMHNLPADAKAYGEEYILGIPTSSIPRRKKCGEVLNALHTRETTFHTFLAMGFEENDVNAAVMEARGDYHYTAEKLLSEPEPEPEGGDGGGGGGSRKRRKSSKRRRKSKTKRRRKTKTRRRRRR